MNKTVRDWYEDSKNVEEMRRWECPRLKIWEEKAAASFPEGARILDIGCGFGREAFVLNGMGFDVTGIDISGEVISEVSALSASKGYNIPFMLYDGHTLPFAADSFDAVVIWAQTFGLLYGDEYKHEILCECRRVLKAGGALSFSAHDYAFLSENYGRFLKDRRFYPYADTELYWETFTAEELTRYAEKALFNVTLCGPGEIYKPEDGTVLHCLCEKTV